MRKYNIKTIILIAFITLVLLFFAVELGIYLILRSEAEKYRTMDISIKTTDELDIVGMLDSYGVPYSPEVDSSFFDIYAQELEDEGKLGSQLDIFGLYLNKTWHLDGIFTNGITIGEMKKMQNFSIDFNRHKYESVIRSDLNYSVSEELADMSVYDYVAGLDKPMICYSCSANDLFYYYGFSLEGLNFERCIELVTGFDDARNLLSSGVKSNIETLLECNPDSQIYVFGLYVPSDYFFVQRIGALIIDPANRDLQAICNQYSNVHFVDVSCVSFEVLNGDFHPNQDGQKIMAAILAEAINDTYVSPKSDREPVFYSSTISVKADSEYSIYINEIINGINTTCLPLDDYVEAAVAIEQTLYDLGIEKMDYQDLSILKEAIISGVDPDIRVFISNGIDICIIERKILYGVTESDFSSHPDIVLNDKLSLIDYY